MSIENPTGPPSKDPHEEYERYRIEREKEDRGAGKTPHDDSLLLFAGLLHFLRKTLDFFIKPAPKIGQEVKENLSLLKTSFEILKKEDRSQDTQFLNHLSEVWNQTLTHAIRHRELQPLIQDIQSYPKGQDHTFGYYLSEKGSDQLWLPLPYMELIQKIHWEHTVEPDISALTQWTRQLDILIASR